jgi:N4-(beta-N-acetylglucosaminyl)-L-asparaginase
VGAACATGHGEFAMKTLGSFLIVEKMRDGYPPLDACKYAINRLAKKKINIKDFQLAYIAINKAGDHAGYSYRQNFEYAIVSNDKTELIRCKHLK